MNTLWFDTCAVAAFLGAANPSWSKQVIRKIFDGNLRVTAPVETGGLSINWDDDVAAFDDIMNDAIAMRNTSFRAPLKQSSDSC